MWTIKIEFYFTSLLGFQLTMVFIYVLQLKDNKWYIGKTETSKFRIDTHFDSAGSEFTKKYPPEEIYQIIPECDKYDEDKYVKKYMDKYGIDNVRGGSYSKLEITTEEKQFIQKELWGANDLCFLCGGDHFVKDCPHNQKIDDLKEESTEDDERLKWIKYYENQLFEIEHGCWVLNKTGCSNGTQITSRTDKTILVDKIYSKYNEPPIKFTDIEDIKFNLDGKETNTFEGKLLLNSKTNLPRNYSILIKFKESKSDFNSRFYICYDYNFSLLTYPRNPRKGYHDTYFTEENKKDIEFKLFMLKNEKKEEPELKLSKTLTNKINTNKRLFEDNFNKILYKIDEIMNNIPELVIAYNMGWGNQNIPSNGGYYINPAEEYKPNKVIGFEIKLHSRPANISEPNKNIDIIICYEHLQPIHKGFNKYQLYTKDKNNLDIKLKPNDPALICSKLNELGFYTKYTGNYSGIKLNTIQNESFAIMFEDVLGLKMY